ncbi:MAG: tRNA adenosine deaminase-associated protein [Nocardioides sp.]|nr:tRNA adenosine deaminase-associated protein [Nocardioides sp.]
MTEELDSVDFAVAAFRRDGAWQVQELAAPAFESVSSLAESLQRLGGDEGGVAMVAVDEEFFVLVRVHDAIPRVLLSDVGAAETWELAQSALEFLGVHVTGDEAAPAGDLDLLHDLGVHTLDLAVLLEDGEMYPDEQLGEIARLAGFGAEFDEAVGAGE